MQGFAYDPAHESFLWLESLAVPDETYILPILSAASTFIISWQTTPKDAPSNQKTMLLLMPIMIGWMSLNFPSGLVIYWIVCNLYQLVQQTIMYRDEMVERLSGNTKSKGTLTVHGENQPKAEPKKKKIIRKKVIRKVVKKKEDGAPKGEAESDNKKDAAPKAESSNKDVKDAGDNKPVKAESKDLAEATGEADETK